MPVVGRYFPSQRSKEKVYLLLRRHWFTYAIFLMITILMAIPLVIIFIYWFLQPEFFEGIITNFLILGISAYTLFIMALLLYGFIDYYLDVYIVTNQRIVDIKQNGFFRREIAELRLHQVQDVKAKVKGAFPTLMHYGDIHIQTAGGKENFYFKSIPHPYRVSKMIINLHESHIEQRFKEFENLVEEGANPDQIKKVLEKDKNKTKKAVEEESVEDDDIIEPKEEFEDIGTFGREIFSKARKNTKRLIGDVADGSRGETDSMNVSDEIGVEEKKMVLEGLEKDEESTKTHSDIEVTLMGGDKSDKKEGIKKENTAESESGEMHENEEIDI